MKNSKSRFLLPAGLLFLAFTLIVNVVNANSNANIIYIEPVNNADYVSVDNNIIIGFDEIIENSDLRSLITVTGTISGVHDGKMILTGDKKKLIFKPYRPFVFNEIIKVKFIGLKTSSGSAADLNYTFRTQPSKEQWDYKMNLINEMGNSSLDELQNSMIPSDNSPLTVSVFNNPSSGNLYMANFPASGIYNPGLIIADNTGSISYYKEVNIWALDFRKQSNGFMTYFTNGKFYEENNQHTLLDSFVCGNGYGTDHHEFQISDNGHFFLMSYDPEIVDMSQIVPGGNPGAVVTGLIIQELDENKNVVFQWRSWDHFAITDAIHENLTAASIDCVHGNAIDLDRDGNLLISSRHLSEITKINRTTGNVIWRLGGIHNQFTFPNDPVGFSYQHHIRRIQNGNITLFDNGNFHSPPFSRAIEYRLDETNKIATLVWQYRNNPDIYGSFMGTVQRLHNGNTLIGWGGTNPTLKEVTPSGNTELQMTLPTGVYSYRVFRDEVKLTLNLTLVLEGFYNKQTNKMNMSDTVRAYLRGINSPYIIVDSAKSVIDSSGFSGNFGYYNASPGTYYISIKHRNSLETWSKAGGESFISGGVFFYNFTNSKLKAYGNNLLHKGSKYCIYSGDVNQDGFVDLADKGMIDNDVSVYTNGYYSSDVTGDGFVDINDAAISENNGLNYVGIIRP